VRNFIQYLKILRVWEVAGKIGFVLIGALFAIQKMDFPTILILLKIAGYSFINGLAIFIYNAWSGYDTDHENERLYFLRDFSKEKLLWLMLFLFAVSLAIIFVHNQNIIFTALSVIILWTVYSLPKYGLKGFPFGGIFVSFITEILLFHLSYLFFADYSLRSVLISIYFALLVAAGHSLHELIDHDADKRSDFQTTAVVLNKKFKSILVPFFYVLSLLWLIGLRYEGYISFATFLSFSIVNFSVLVFGFNQLSEGKYHEFRRVYLSLFALATLVCVCLNNFPL